MLVIARNTSLVLFAAGMFVFPIVFGSASGAVSLVISLIWFLCFAFKKETWTELPLFMKIWAGAALAFFPLYAITASEPKDIIYAFNQFAFLLAVGVYWFLQKCVDRRALNYLAYAALAGLLFGAFWAIHRYIFIGPWRITNIVGNGPNFIARVAALLFISCCLFKFTYVKNGTSTILVTSATAATAILLLLARSEGALLTLPILGYALAQRLTTNRYSGTTSLLITMLAFSICTVIFVVIVDNSIIQILSQRLSTLISGATTDAPTAARVAMLNVGIKSLYNNPVVGTGWHSISDIVSTINVQGVPNTAASFHADITNFSVAGGVAGIMLFALLLFAPLLTSLRVNKTPATKWHLITLLTVFVLGLTDETISYDYIAMFYAFSAAIWQRLNDGHENQCST